MAASREDWLGLTQEAPIDPDLPIIDPHHHLWDHPGGRYLLDELLADTAGHNVVKTVFVECLSMYDHDAPTEMQPVGETDFVRGLSDMSRSRGEGAMEVAAGIVGFADLLLADAAAPVLEAHMAAGGGRFKGIRHASSWDPSKEIRNAHTRPPEGLLLDAGFRKGFSLLNKYNLSFDTWLYHPQLAELADLAQAFSGTPIILDHMGGVLGIGPYAGNRDEVYASWQKGIDAVAACDNVAIKLGGLCMSSCGFGWHQQEKPPTSEALAEAMKPYVHHCIERFGIKRCMFESNFPVDKVSCSYTVLWNAFKRLTADFPPDERAALFHDTAASVYRL